MVMEKVNLFTRFIGKIKVIHVATDELSDLPKDFCVCRIGRFEPQSAHFNLFWFKLLNQSS